MGQTIKLAVSGAVAFMVMKNFCRNQLAPIVRLTLGGIAPHWPAAYGALFGLVVYGVYDFTNYSTLRQWPSVLTLADVAWGTAASAACAAAVRMVFR